MNDQIKIRVNVVVEVRRGRWVAFCPDLKTFASASEQEGPEKALDNLAVALDTFLQVHKKRNTLKSTLINWGLIEDDAVPSWSKYFNFTRPQISRKKAEKTVGFSLQPAY